MVHNPSFTTQTYNQILVRTISGHLQVLNKKNDYVINLKHLEKEYCVVQSARLSCERRVSYIFFFAENSK